MRRLNITVIAGILAAILGVAIVITYGHSVDKRVADGQATIGVLVATDEIAAGSSASALTTKVEVKQVPRAYVGVDALPANALTLLPKGSVLRVPVAKGTQLTKSSFTTPGAVGSVAGALAPSVGKDGIVVKVGMVPGAAHYVTPGTVVDLYVTYKSVKADPNAYITTPVVTKLFASSVKVLSITPNGTASNAAVAPTDDVLLVLEADPNLAQRIINAQAVGDLYVGLTNGEKHTTSNGATPTDVLNGAR